MLLIDVVVKFRNTYAALVAENPSLIYTKRMKKFQADMQDLCLKNEILTDVEIMNYLMEECDFLKEVTEIKNKNEE